MSAESVQLDNANDYVIAGDELAIGSGGLTASPATGPTGRTGDVIAISLKLAATQKWSISGRGSLTEEAGLLLASKVTGVGSALELELANEPALYFAENDTEVGPVTIKGTNTSEAGIFNGVVAFLEGKLDSSDAQPVALDHIFFTGSGAVGALTTDDAELDVGSPAESIEATSARFDAASEVEFNIASPGEVAKTDYSQLESRGPIELNNAKVGVAVVPPKKGAACPTLAAGSTYTFISTTGALSGAFANAPEHGAELPIRFAQACAQKSQKIRIAYHESGTTQTVTGTVEKLQPNRVKKKKPDRPCHRPCQPPSTRPPPLNQHSHRGSSKPLSGRRRKRQPERKQNAKHAKPRSSRPHNRAPPED